MRAEAVVFIFVDDNEQRVFMEERSAKHSNAGQMLYPGGRIEIEDNSNNQDETRLAALRREIEEELGVKPTNVEQLFCEPPVTSAKGTLLHPYIINSFEGQLPSAIRDEGNRTSWERISDALVSPVDSVRALTAALVNQLSERQTPPVSL